jgi:hydroxymethylbilane synthase
VRIRIGTRGSALALVQANAVADRLRRSGHDVELVTIVTAGDRRAPDTSPSEGSFVAAIAAAVSAREVDIAVHSAKDVPLEAGTDLVLAAFPERADPRDALVTPSGVGLDGLPPRAVVGTDSPRRTGFLLAARGDLDVRPLHGNVDTRLRRLDAGEADALVLACAGLDRLGRGDRAGVRLPPELVPPAPGQGALAVQARRDDVELGAALAVLDVPEVRLEVTLEREVLAGAGGGCRAPVGALARHRGGAIELLVAAVAPGGGDVRRSTLHLDPRDPDAGRAARSAGEALRAVLA